MTNVLSSTRTSSQQTIAGWLSPEEFALLEVLCDTFLPALEPPEGSSENVQAYYRRAASDLHVAFVVAETLALEDGTVHAELHQFFALLQSPLGGLLCVGKPLAFGKLSLSEREKYLRTLANSPLPQLRKGYQAFKRLSNFIYFALPDEHGINPNWSILDYTAPAPPPVNRSRPIEPLALFEDTVLDADAVIIGSGAGGSVVAAELARAGKSVIILEKGGYNHEGNFTLQEAQAMPELYLKRGNLTSKDLGINILAGSTLGGGTTINWTTSLRATPEVLTEWEASSGLHGCFTGPELQRSYQTVEERIRVNAENSAHNRQNQLLADGCEALGYHAGVIPRNALACEQRCGTCGFGCRYGSKQSTMKTYLQDAYDAGARIVVNCSAETVLIENARAVGVKAHVVVGTEKYSVIVHAKTVIVAAGALSSPALLLRSGLENPHIGRHLKLHPVSCITGIYREKVYPWQGVMQSAFSREFARLDGNHGYVLEVAPTHPGLMALSAPWHNARQYREQMAQIAHFATIIVLTRDKGEGTITVNRHGEPIIDYVVSVYDRKHLLHGLRQAAYVHRAAGARALNSLHSKPTRIEGSGAEGISDRQLREFGWQLERHGMGVNRLLMFTAHQMGTCRMGADPNTSVTNEHGKVHGVSGLFVCDSSLFPAASGVNPMLTIMSLVHMISREIKSFA